MGLIPKTTCRRCQHQYSSVRSRCPHCGARRIQSTTRTAEPTGATQPGTAPGARASNNAKWQMIFGIALLTIVIVVVIVLITVAINGRNGAGKESSSPSPVEDTETPTSSPTPSPSPTTAVTSISITYYGSEKTDVTIPIGDDIQFDASVYPLEVDSDSVIWSSGDTAIFTVDDSGLVHAVAKGVSKLIATCGDVSAECVIRVN